jgi:HlyD family secretion protein
LQATGIVVPIRMATVSASETGRVAALRVRVGDAVRKGQILAELDSRQVAASLDELSARREQLTATKSELQTKLALASRSLDRLTALRESGAVSAAQLEDAQMNATGAQSALEAATAAINAASASITATRVRLSLLFVVAPFDGTVLEINAEEGEVVSPFSAGGAFTRTGVATIGDLSQMEVESLIGENYINRIAVGQPVDIELIALSDLGTLRGRVSRLSRVADAQRAGLKVFVSFDKPEPRLLPNLSAQLHFLPLSATLSSTPATIESIQ